MVSAVIAYMRDYPGDRRTICSEPVMSWLEAGGVRHGIDGRLQRRLFERVGFSRGVNEVLDRIGMKLELPRCVTEGEPLIFEAPNGRVLCGLAGPGGLSVAYASGVMLVAPCRVLRVARWATHA